MDPSMSSSSFAFNACYDDRQQIPGIHVNQAEESLFDDFLRQPFLPSQSFDALFPDAPWPLPTAPPAPTGLTVPYASSSNGSSDACSTSEAELLASFFAPTSPAASSSSPPETSFLPDERVFYVPVDDGRGGQKLAAIDWDDFRGFLANQPMAGGDLRKAARTLALCKPIHTTFSGVTPPVHGQDLLPSPTGSSSPGHVGSRKLKHSHSDGSNGRTGAKHRGPRIRSLSEQHLRACPVEIESPTEPLAVWWDGSLSRACVPELGKSSPTEEEGRWIIFAPHEWHRVFLIDANTSKRTEVFPWSSKEGSNFWIRGQAMGIKECPCGEFSFFTHSKPDKDPFKRPSVLRKHFGECSKRPDEHPLRLLSVLQAGANTRARFHRSSASGPALVSPPSTSATSPPASLAPAPPPFTASTSTGSLIAPLMASALFSSFTSASH